MKKVLAIVMVLALMFSLAACGNGGGDTATPAPDNSGATTPAPDNTQSDPAAPDPEPATTGRAPIAKEDLKVGVVHIMDLGDQGYSFNHDQGVKQMLSALGLSEDQYIPKFNIDDQDVAATNAAINELIEQGCQIIFATSFSYGTQVVEAAKAHPEVEFCHATGLDAHFEDLSNLHNYFAKIHQARYLAGIAAGMKTESNKLGYVAAYPYAEVISGFTAFYLGAKSVNPDVTMDVMYIDSWGDAQKEKEVADALIKRGCDVISQHSDNVSPAIAAQDAGAFHVGYNNDMAPAAPNASLISARINWGNYMTYAVQCMIDGTPISVDWGEGVESGAAYLSPLNTAIAAEGTQDAIDAAMERIKGGELIFKGALKAPDGSPAAITSFEGDVIFTFEDENSAFVESGDISAPSFNAIIEGINVIS
ncbi:BMP family ABC transporter substrate-binding protein [Christensenellaceae bacterium OttesenSCG-928-M15]|nr:BMP family ABC transporter substrate-binding protein [Christensenellaceae bacterium OttesenSCG-928-M15]